MMRLPSDRFVDLTHRFVANSSVARLEIRGGVPRRVIFESTIMDDSMI